MKRLVVLCLLSLLTTEVSATTLVYKDFNDLVTEADAIVVGTVRSVESYYGPDQYIYTAVTLEALDFLYGATDEDTLVIRLDGGQVDGEVQQIIGSPKFQPAERVVLFIRDNGEKIVPFVGWTQGVFRLTQDQDTGTTVVYDHDGNRILGMSDATLLKDHRHSPESHIVHLETGDYTGDEPESQWSSPPVPGGGPGRDDAPASPIHFQKQSDGIDQQAIEAEDFLDFINQQLSQRNQTASSFVQSADLLEEPRSLSTDTAPGTDRQNFTQNLMEVEPEPAQPWDGESFLPRPWDSD